MAFDFYGVLRASEALSKESLTLAFLRRSLVAYQSTISGSWTGEDAATMMAAVQALIAKIDRAQQQINSSCREINNAAARLKAREDTERAQAGIAGTGR